MIGFTGMRKVAQGRLAPAEGVRRLLAAHGAVQRRVLAHLVAAYACGVSTWAALDLARAPHAEAHALHEAVRRMRRRYGVPYTATINFRPGGGRWAGGGNGRKDR